MTHVYLVCYRFQVDDYRTKIEINRIREEKAALEEYRKSQEKLRQEELESRLKV